MKASAAVPRWRSTVVLAVLALIAASCGGDDTGATTTTAPTTTAATTTQATTTTQPPATTSSTTTTTEPPTTTTTTLAGVPFDLGFPREGDRLAVIGVEFDDVLNVRAGPGIDQPIVATLSPTSNEAIATGRLRQLPQSIWAEVQIMGVTGWANFSFFAYLGATDDITSSVVEKLGEIPVAETMVELGELVAEAEASTEPPSRITLTVAPSVGDLGEVTYDVVGLGDDALRGLRLHVFGQPVEGGGGFSLKAVEATLLCGRGLAEGGICV